MAENDRLVSTLLAIVTELRVLNSRLAGRVSDYDEASREARRLVESFTEIPPTGIFRTAVNSDVLLEVAGVDRPDAEDWIGNRYRLREKLGQGGFGTVFRALDEVEGHEVAVKRIDLHLRDNYERDLHELKALQGLDHPNIARVFDVVEEASCAWIVLEFADRGTLRTPHFSLCESLNLLLQCCDALSYAHANDRIHCDVKPDNIGLKSSADGTEVQSVKLLDFGLSIVAQLSRDGAITGEGVCVGSPQYMSLEQWEMQVLDARTDVFSLGLVAFELVTGEPALSGRPFEILGKLTTDGVPLLPDTFPEGLRDSVARATQTDRDARFQSIEAFRSALASSLADLIKDD